MFAIRAAVAFDGERFRDDGATVLVEGDRLVGVEGAHHEPPADCSVTTYDGTLLPGLFDTHVHLVADGTPGGLERAPTLPPQELDEVITASLHRQAAAGVTTVRDLGDCGYRTLGHRDPVPGRPRVLSAGPPLTVPDGHCHFLGGAVEGPAAVEAAVAERAERQVDVVKVMASGGLLTPGTDVLGVQFSPDELALAVREAHRHGLPLVAHAHSLAGAWAASDAGVDGIEHVSCLTEEGVRTPEELLVRLAEQQVVLCPTLGTDPERTPSLELAPPPLRELAERLGVTPAEMPRKRAEQMTRVRAHGIVVVSGSDAGIAPAKDHGGVWRSVLDLLLADYSVAEALASATSVAARVCGVGHETGRLAAGLAADLLVADADLRADPDALGRPEAVWIRGKQVAGD
ncbi:MAG TPA: amidohydrolase family protein [Nocardioides sp.]|nr:amidohydrolase family protein [Nocardioides sp.]